MAVVKELKADAIKSRKFLRILRIKDEKIFKAARETERSDLFVDFLSADQVSSLLSLQREGKLPNLPKEVGEKLERLRSKLDNKLVDIAKKGGHLDKLNEVFSPNKIKNLTLEGIIPQVEFTPESKLQSLQLAPEGAQQNLSGQDEAMET